MKAVHIRISCIIVALLMLIGCCGCDTAAIVTPVASGDEGAQYVIALNPSIAVYEDSKVVSVRNSTSASMQKDLSAGTVNTLYNETPWQWLAHTDDGKWSQRLIRRLDLWRGAQGKKMKKSLYAYTVTDSGLSSLSLYDSAKMDIKGVNSGELPASGVIMSFTGEKEEVLCYTADKDCTVDISDRDGGNISVVSSIYGVGADFTTNKDAKKAVVVRVYKNSRIYWQEVLEAGTTAVPFPSFTNLKLKMGDRICVTAQAIDDASGIIRGNCDLPATTATVTEKVPTETKVEVVNVTGIPFVDDSTCQFTIVRNKNAAITEIQTVKKLYDGMCDKLATEVEYKTDEVKVEGRRILVQSVNDPAAKAVLSEVKNGRKANYADFIIRLLGDDIVIAAATNLGLELAIDFFLNNYCTSFDAQLPLKLDYVSSSFNPIKKITLAGNDISKYRIVVSKTASFMETTAANLLVKELAVLCGINIPLVTDSQSPKQDYEICIGDTNRGNYRGVAEASKVNLDAVNLVDASASKYEIKVEEKKVSILADHISGVNAGVLKFISLIKTNNALAKGTVNGQYDGSYSLIDGYKLTFADEFDGNYLKKHWTIFGIGGEVTTNWTGGTTRTKLPTLKDGNLVNTVSWKRNGDGTIDIDKSEIASEGRNKMNFMWGYFEIRIKFAKTWGLTHSVFTQGPIAGGFLEANIIESFGDPYNSKFNMHSWGNGGHINHNASGSYADTILNNSPGVSSAEPFGEEYHTFGWEWTDDWSQFYCDGKKTWYFEHSTSKFDQFDKPAWLIISIRSAYEAGGSQPSGYGGANLEKNPFFMDETMDYFSDAALVDYVHIYQKDNGSVMYIKP